MTSSATPPSDRPPAPPTPPGAPGAPGATGHPPAGPPAAPRSGRQEARRREILRAATELARAGGYDAVQMREVAESAGVALGTLYRYFPSKIHLLVAVLQDQLRLLHATVRENPPRERGAGARVAAALMRAFHAMRDEPHLASAMVRALTAADRSVSAEVDTVLASTTGIVLEAMGSREPVPPAALSAVRVIEHTWFSLLIAWLSGRATIATVRTDLATVCRLADAPPGAGEN
ncbi:MULTISPECIES: TetR family transcriptional regulator [Streptomyces]|uniref:TetR family transcriptional regulator n=1 Tax=Streptomyces TaxID=1883 RepID=UPI002248BDCD|nr:TetR family transcriptional regulator [Streptomyces sp. JHD 1]MCX2967830.1 TetR family transcriptional regulator [Streptomyces sp. JHD 1]